MADLSEDEAILAELGVEVVRQKNGAHTPRQERLIAGFEDILRFVETQGRAPQHGEERDIFERLYAVRLDRLRALPDAKALLSPMDPAKLLSSGPLAPAARDDELDDEALLAELGIDGDDDASDITKLRHVSTYEERKAAEDIANRKCCSDFEKFKPLFERAEIDLKSGVRKTLRFGRDASVAQGNFFILGGQMVYVAEMGEPTRTPNGEPDARLRVIYSNGTESDLLMRSLQRALYKDDTGRRLTDPDSGPLFGDTLEDDDIVNGTIYVLQSESDDPYIIEHREIIHKIGVTAGKVETRIANARNDATYILADVRIVRRYQVANLNRVKLENLFHKLFSSAQLDLMIFDRFGNPVRPREWFLVPLPVIDEAVNRILDGSIAGMIYDPRSAQLVKR